MDTRGEPRRRGRREPLGPLSEPRLGIAEQGCQGQAGPGSAPRGQSGLPSGPELPRGLGHTWVLFPSKAAPVCAEARGAGWPSGLPWGLARLCLLQVPHVLKGSSFPEGPGTRARRPRLGAALSSFPPPPEASAGGRGEPGGPRVSGEPLGPGSVFGVESRGYSGIQTELGPAT